MMSIITISRSYGSGGKEIGKELAKTLGMKYYGREILELSYGGETYSDDESINDSSLAELEAKFKKQSEIIRSVAEKEDCVIVGRCADYVLSDMDNKISVYLYAPLRDCMKRVTRLYELNPDDAKSLIHSMNKTRGDYYEHNTGRKWSDLTHYDLCINTAGLSKEQCVQIIMDYAKLKLEL